MLTLPLMLFIVLVELCVGQFAVMFLLDWRNSVKRKFLILYAFIYLLLTWLTYAFQQGFSTPELLNSFADLNHAWTSSLSLPLLLFLLLQIPYTFILLLDKKAGIANDGKPAEDVPDEPRGISKLYIARMIAGGVTVLAGLYTLFVVGMIYQPIGGAGLGGVLVVGGFFAAALALGGVMTAMWLGHWYLVTPEMTEEPLLLSTTLVLVGLVLELLFFFVAGAHVAPVSAHTVVYSKLTIISMNGTPQPTATVSSTTTTIKPSDVPTAVPLDATAIQLCDCPCIRAVPELGISRRNYYKI